MKDLKYLYDNYEKLIGETVTLEGWVRTNRNQKDIGFIDFYDGTYFKSIQLVYSASLDGFKTIAAIKNGSSIKVTGKLNKSPKEGQAFEIEVSDITLLGDCPDDYPLQPKRHTREFLREIAYLRPRANLFQAGFRIRSLAAFAVHKYFNERNFVYVNTPVITANDGEGAGEMFNVSTLKPEDKGDFSKDFFGKKVGLTVTGQLEGETFAMAFNKIYTFGPTFRAEHSNTKNHAAEFWMIEPEIAFADLHELMDIEEDMLKYVIKYILDNAKEELKFLDSFVEPGLIKKLEDTSSKTFTRIKHKDAITLLKEEGKDFVIAPEYGEDLAKEHEVFLTKHFDGPVFVTDWPKDIKAFYMKLNPDNETVAAVDLLVPGSGELMGGSQREEDYDKLKMRLKDLKMNEEEYWWYLNLRKYGTCVHSGFGMGFERLIIYLTGIDNIRDVIPYPRTVGNCEY